MVLDGKSSQEYLVNAGVPQGFILDPSLFMIFLIMLSVVLLSILMILMYILSVIKHVISTGFV